MTMHEYLFYLERRDVIPYLSKYNVYGYDIEHFSNETFKLEERFYKGDIDDRYL